MRIKTGRHGLIHRVGILLASSIPTLDLHMFADFRMKVSSTIALRVKTIDGPPTTSSRFFFQKLFISFGEWIEF